MTNIKLFTNKNLFYYYNLLMNNTIKKLKLNKCLFDEFVKENKNKLFNMPDHSIDQVRKETYINLHNNLFVQSVVRELVNNIKYVDIKEYSEKVKEICDAYNEVKKDNIYILLFVYDFINQNTHTKSNFYSTIITSLYLNYDYVININMKDYIKNKQLFMELINDIATLKNIEKTKIYFFICDDCVYSGEQIGTLYNYFLLFFDTYQERDTHCKFIIPYILNLETRNIIIDVCKPLCQMYETIINRNSNEIKMTADIIKVCNIKYEQEYTKYVKYCQENNLQKYDNDTVFDRFGKNYLIYFNFKFADYMSINQMIISGKIIRLLKTDVNPQNNKYYHFINDENISKTINWKNTYYYPFIKNCIEAPINWDKFYYISEICPYKLYKDIKYTYLGINLNLMDDSLNLFDKIYGIKYKYIRPLNL